MRGRISAGMPGPVLAMATSAVSATRRKLRVTVPLRVVVLDGIVGEVQQQLAQAVAVAGHGQLLTGRQADLDVMRAGEALGIGAGFPDQLIQAHRFAGERDLAGIGLGQQREAVHDLGQALHFIQLAFQLLPLRGR